MNDASQLALAWAGGGGLGAIFFGSLWWTTNKGIRSEHPALWFSFSLMLRMSLLLTGFYYIGSGRWERFLLCLLGFVMARIVVTRLIRPPISEGNTRSVNGHHAP